MNTSSHRHIAENHMPPQAHRHSDSSLKAPALYATATPQAHRHSGPGLKAPALYVTATSHAHRHSDSSLKALALLALTVLLGACSKGAQNNAAPVPTDRIEGSGIRFVAGQVFAAPSAPALSTLVSLGQVQYTLTSADFVPVFALSGRGAGQFRIDAQANLYIGEDFDFNIIPASIQVGAFATAASLEAIATVTITIAATANAVVIIESGQSFTLNRSTPSSTITIGRLDYSARNLSAALSFSLAGDAADVFAIDSTGQLYLNEALSGSSTSYTLTVRAHAGTTTAPVLASAPINIVYSGQPAALTIDFSATITNSPANNLRTIRFTPTVPVAISPASWRWDFGDDSPPSIERAPVHTYADSGTYTVQMDLAATGGQSATVTHKVYVPVGDDPLKPLQWYLANSPASPFVAALTFSGRSLVHTAPNGEILARAGEDIRAPDFRQACGVLDTCRGEGVVIQIVDRSVQLLHPDLVDNTQRQLSKNLSRNASSQTDAFSGYNLVSPLTETSSRFRRFELEQRNRTLAHGTATAGIVAARDLNGRGITGVAPRAELAGYNFLDNQTDANRLTSITDLGLDVSNNSWSAAVPIDSGPPAEYLSVPSVTEDAIEQVMALERNGLGRIFVKSSGNSGAENSPHGRQYGNRQNATGEGLQNLRYILAIGAIDADGEASTSSEGGANILTVAYENQPCGRSIAFVSFVPANPLAIVTTDPVGPIGSVYNVPQLLFGGTPNQPELFEVPDDILDYTYCFGGTSASAPMVSGAAALLLQARPDLSWRDVRAIFAHSARRNDATSTGWAINGAGLATHYQYGFGTLDINHALGLAREWQILATEIAYDSGTMTVNGTIPDASIPARIAPPPQSAGASYVTQLIPATPIKSLESVQVEMRLRFVSTDETKEGSRALRGTVSISLEHISPTGELISSSLLHKLHPYYANYNSTDDNSASSNTEANNASYIDWTYLTLRHFGEAPTGNWRLRITDFVNDNSTITLESWRLVMHGH